MSVVSRNLKKSDNEFYCKKYFLEFEYSISQNNEFLALQRYFGMLENITDNMLYPQSKY